VVDGAQRPRGNDGAYRSGVAFCRSWESPPLAPWEGPFADPHQRLPQEARVAAQRRAEQRRWRERQLARKAAKLAGADLIA
jgi:hypothetical protein